MLCVTLCDCTNQQSCYGTQVYEKWTQGVDPVPQEFLLNGPLVCPLRQRRAARCLPRQGQMNPTPDIHLSHTLSPGYQPRVVLKKL